MTPVTATREFVYDDTTGRRIGEVALNPATGLWAGRVDGVSRRLTSEYPDIERAIALVRKAAADHTARLAREAALPQGDRFALAIRRHLHIGPRTHRRRNGRQVCDDIRTYIRDEADYPSGTLDGQAAATGSHVLYLYETNIRTGRLSTRLWTLLADPEPWKLIGLLADLLDADVQHVGDLQTYLRTDRWHAFADTRHADLPPAGTGHL